MNEKLYDSQFTARWRSHFWKINKDCFIPLPFDLSEIAYTDNQTILPYVEIANKHIKIWHWPSIFKLIRSICETISRFITFARVCLFGIPFLFIAVFIYPVLMAWGLAAGIMTVVSFINLDMPAPQGCATIIGWPVACYVLLNMFTYCKKMTWLEDDCYDGWHLRLSYKSFFDFLFDN